MAEWGVLCAEVLDKGQGERLLKRFIVGEEPAEDPAEVETKDEIEDSKLGNETPISEIIKLDRFGRVVTSQKETKSPWEKKGQRTLNLRKLLSRAEAHVAPDPRELALRRIQAQDAAASAAEWSEQIRR